MAAEQLKRGRPPFHQGKAGERHMVSLPTDMVAALREVGKGSLSRGVILLFERRPAPRKPRAARRRSP